MKVLKAIIYGVEKALWDALGRGSLAFTPFIGENICEEMSNIFGKNIESSSLDELLEEMGHFYVEKLGFSESFDVKRGDSEFSIEVKGCSLLDVEERLIKDGVTPFICPLMNSVAYIVRKKLGVKSRIKSINVDPENRTCRLSFEILG